MFCKRAIGVLLVAVWGLVDEPHPLHVMTEQAGGRSFPGVLGTIRVVGGFAGLLPPGGRCEQGSSQQGEAAQDTARPAASTWRELTVMLTTHEEPPP
jgi:hypothetical protein